MLSRLREWMLDHSDTSNRRRLFKTVSAVIILYLSVMIIVGIFVSREPVAFEVSEVFSQRFENETPVTGSLTTLSLVYQIETMLDKPWGYLANDITPPGIWLDNIPNWEYGVLIESRDLIKAMREQFSRSQSQSIEDPALKLAEPYLNYNSKQWILPSSEQQYRDSIAKIDEYLHRLQDPQNQEAQFYARADNLNYWLTTVGTRLGSYSQRLAASVGPDRINTNLSGDLGATSSSEAPGLVSVRTPWLEIDDVFYETRGYCWALSQSLRAIEYDFADVLEKKRAKESLQQIIRELDGTQRTLWSPVVLNGGGYGMLANHSLVMSNYVSRANAALIDLRDLLNNG